MAIIIHKFAVIVRRFSINSTYLGGVDQFVCDHPEHKIAIDDYLVSIHFDNIIATRRFIKMLTRHYLIYADNQQLTDIILIDPNQHLQSQSDWSIIDYCSCTIEACRCRELRPQLLRCRSTLELSRSLPVSEPTLYGDFNHSVLTDTRQSTEQINISDS